LLDPSSFANQGDGGKVPKDRAAKAGFGPINFEMAKVDEGRRTVTLGRLVAVARKLTDLVDAIIQQVILFFL
jgi:hypothetical protein